MNKNIFIAETSISEVGLDYEKIGLDYAQVLKKTNFDIYNENYEFFNYSIPESFNPSDLDKSIICGYLNSIRVSFSELITKYHFSICSDKLSETIKNDDYKNYWKYFMRNPNARVIIGDSYSIVEYLCFFINYLSRHEYFKEDVNVNFIDMNNKVKSKKFKNKGSIIEDDIIIIKKIFEILDKTFGENEFSNIRNIYTHRYFIAIDEGAPMVIKDDFIPITSQKTINYTEFVTGYKGHVEGFNSFTFEDINKINKLAIESLADALKLILKIDVIDKYIIMEE